MTQTANNPTATRSTPTPAGSDAMRPDPTRELLTMAMIRRQYLPLGTRTIFRMIATGKFPKADMAFGAKQRFWKRSTVQRWVDEQTADNDIPDHS